MDNPFKPTSNVTFGTPTPPPTTGGELTSQQQQYIAETLKSMQQGVSQFETSTSKGLSDFNHDLALAEQATLEHSSALQNYSPDVVREATRVPMERLASQRSGGMLGLSLQAQNAKNLLSQNAIQSEISLRRDFTNINLSREVEQRRNDLSRELARDIRPTPLEDALRIGGTVGMLAALVPGIGWGAAAMAAGVGGIDYLARALNW